MKRIFYFGYGSNLLTQRLTDRVGRVISRGNHTLEDHQLVFNCGGFANIIPSRGNSVDGHLYELSPIQLKELNTYEGFYNMEFFDIDENTIGVVFIGMEHIVDRTNWQLPSRNYLAIILAGMQEKGITKNYNTTLELYYNLPKPKIKVKAKIRRK